MIGETTKVFPQPPENMTRHLLINMYKCIMHTYIHVSFCMNIYKIHILYGQFFVIEVQTML